MSATVHSARRAVMHVTKWSKSRIRPILRSAASAENVGMAQCAGSFPRNCESPSEAISPPAKVDERVFQGQSETEFTLPESLTPWNLIAPLLHARACIAFLRRTSRFHGFGPLRVRTPTGSAKLGRRDNRPIPGSSVPSNDLFSEAQTSLSTQNRYERSSKTTYLSDHRHASYERRALIGVVRAPRGIS